MTHLQITRPAPSNRGVVETHRVPAHTAQQDTVPRGESHSVVSIPAGLSSS